VVTRGRERAGAVYGILPGREYEQSVAVLGAEYDGFLIHDGWGPIIDFHSRSIKVVWPMC
jgi:hypothetical protein